MTEVIAGPRTGVSDRAGAGDRPAGCPAARAAGRAGR
jgi:hypothetical protein